MTKQNGNSSCFSAHALDRKSRAAFELFLEAAATGNLETLAGLPEADQRAFVNLCDHRGGHMTRTAIIYASQNGHEEMITRLLSLGANINAKDVDGWTALTAAVANGASWVIDLLLDNKADINSTDNAGWTPLMEALNRNKEAIALRLIERGADPRPANSDGMTALEMALDLGHEEAAAALRPILQKLDTDASVAAMRGGTARRIHAPATARFRKAV